MVCTELSKSSNTGAFFWAYFSSPYENSLTTMDGVNTSASILNAPTPPNTPTYTLPSSVHIICPNCKNKIKSSWAAVPP